MTNPSVKKMASKSILLLVSQHEVVQLHNETAFLTLCAAASLITQVPVSPARNLVSMPVTCSSMLNGPVMHF
jgi:hypothetical protein